jgi:hypothetical protein
MKKANPERGLIYRVLTNEAYNWNDAPAKRSEVIMALVDNEVMTLKEAKATLTEYEEDSKIGWIAREVAERVGSFTPTKTTLARGVETPTAAQ